MTYRAPSMLSKVFVGFCLYVIFWRAKDRFLAFTIISSSLKHNINISHILMTSMVSFPEA
jgi:hypothetical protein